MRDVFFLTAFILGIASMATSIHYATQSDWVSAFAYLFLTGLLAYLLPKK